MSQIYVPYLFVLDLNIGTAIQYTITPEHHDMETTELLTALGHQPEHCSFMFSSEPIEKRESVDYDDGIREI
jgi:hypothetical protein